MPGTHRPKWILNKVTCWLPLQLECLIAFQFGLLLSGLNNCFTVLITMFWQSSPISLLKVLGFQGYNSTPNTWTDSIHRKLFLVCYHCDFFCSELRVHSAVVFRILSGLPFDEFHPGTILYILYTVVSQEKTCCLLEVISRPILWHVLQDFVTGKVTKIDCIV